MTVNSPLRLINSLVPSSGSTDHTYMHDWRLARVCGAWRGAAWCGVVWCGVVWCGVVWCGVVWCGVVWCGVVWCGVVW
jgi:hypothetical protein